MGYHDCYAASRYSLLAATILEFAVITKGSVASQTIAKSRPANHCGGAAGAAASPWLEERVDGVKIGDDCTVDLDQEGLVPVPVLPRLGVLVWVRRPVVAGFVLVRPGMLPWDPLDAAPGRVTPACAPADECETTA